MTCASNGKKAWLTSSSAVTLVAVSVLNDCKKGSGVLHVKKLSKAQAFWKSVTTCDGYKERMI